MNMTETKPTLRSLRQQVEAGVEAGYLPRVDDVLDVLDEHDAAAAAIERQPLLAGEKARQRDALDRATQQKIAVAKAAAVTRGTAEHDREEGEIRATFKADPLDGARELRAANVAAMIARAPFNEVQGLFADAELAGDSTQIRAAGYAVLDRLQRAADADRGKSMSPARDRLVAFEATFKAWQRAHPTPRERLDQIQRERAHVATAIEQAAAFATRLYGVGAAPAAGPALRDVPADDGRVRVGPAFDQFFAGKNRTGARR
jgi:hypothetical protein